MTIPPEIVTITLYQSFLTVVLLTKLVDTALVVVGVMADELKGKIPTPLWLELVEIKNDSDIDDSLDYFTKTFKK